MLINTRCLSYVLNNGPIVFNFLFQRIISWEIIKFSIANDSFLIVLVLITFLSNLVCLKRLVFHCCKITFEEIFTLLQVMVK